MHALNQYKDCFGVTLHARALCVVKQHERRRCLVLPLFAADLDLLQGLGLVVLNESHLVGGLAMTAAVVLHGGAGAGEIGVKACVLLRVRVREDDGNDAAVVGRWLDFLAVGVVLKLGEVYYLETYMNIIG